MTYHPPTMQYWAPSPHSLTAIHTRDHLAITAHMKASWGNNQQVALMTLKLRAHKDTHTEFKSLQLPSN